MNMYGHFETNETAEKEGIWVSYGDFQVNIKRMGRSNKAFQKMMEAKTKKYRRQIDLGHIDEKVLTGIIDDCTAHTVVNGWKVRVDGVWHDEKLVLPSGPELVPATPENILVVLTGLPELADAIRDDAKSAETFRDMEQEEDAGN